MPVQGDRKKQVLMHAGTRDADMPLRKTLRTMDFAISLIDRRQSNHKQAGQILRRTDYMTSSNGSCKLLLTWPYFGHLSLVEMYRLSLPLSMDFAVRCYKALPYNICKLRYKLSRIKSQSLSISAALGNSLIISIFMDLRYDVSRRTRWPKAIANERAMIYKSSMFTP